MFEGNLEEGELEIGQVSAMIKTIIPVEKIIKNVIAEFESEKSRISSLKF
jgi:enoyl-[acyl-carrier protein] reductase II